MISWRSCSLSPSRKVAGDGVSEHLISVLSYCDIKVSKCGVILDGGFGDCFLICSIEI